MNRQILALLYARAGTTQCPHIIYKPLTTLVFDALTKYYTITIFGTLNFTEWMRAIKAPHWARISLSTGRTYAVLFLISIAVTV